MSCKIGHDQYPYNGPPTLPLQDAIHEILDLARSKKRPWPKPEPSPKKYCN
jgi:hypothetical protein